MNRTRSRSIWALSLAALMAIVGATATLWALARKDHAQNGLDQARHTRQIVNGQRLNLLREKDGLKNTLIHLEELRRRGALSPERRTRWEEQIAKIRNGLRIAEFSVEFGPPPAPRQPGLSLTENTMTFRARLRHEGEFLNLIAALQKDAIVLPRRCALERNAEKLGITAECSLDRLTLNFAPDKAVQTRSSKDFSLAKP